MVNMQRSTTSRPVSLCRQANFFNDNTVQVVLRSYDYRAVTVVA